MNLFNKDIRKEYGMNPKPRSNSDFEINRY